MLAEAFAAHVVRRLAAEEPAASSTRDWIRGVLSRHLRRCGAFGRLFRVPVSKGERAQTWSPAAAARKRPAKSIAIGERHTGIGAPIYIAPISGIGVCGPSSRESRSTCKSPPLQRHETTDCRPQTAVNTLHEHRRWHEHFFFTIRPYPRHPLHVACTLVAQQLQHDPSRHALHSHLHP